MLSCSVCGGVASGPAAFCQFCGAAFPAQPAAASVGVFCGRCGVQNPAGTNFCHSCGLRVSGGLTPPAAPLRLASVPREPSAQPAQPARLVAVRRDGTDGASYPIGGDQFDIGRTEGDLLFDDPHMAPRHARVQRRAGTYILLPLETLNGVYLRLRDPADLLDGDFVLLGKQVLRFELLPDVERTLRPAVQHGVVVFGTPVKSPWGRLRQMTAAGTSRDVYHLGRSEVVLGREQGDVVFSDDEFLSRRHAQVQYRAGRVTLQDLGSSNGTYLRLRSHHTLFPGDMLRMGDELLRFEIG